MSKKQDLVMWGFTLLILAGFIGLWFHVNDWVSLALFTIGFVGSLWKAKVFK